MTTTDADKLLDTTMRRGILTPAQVHSYLWVNNFSIYVNEVSRPHQIPFSQKFDVVLFIHSDNSRFNSNVEDFIKTVQQTMGTDSIAVVKESDDNIQFEITTRWTDHCYGVLEEEIGKRLTKPFDTDINWYLQYNEYEVQVVYRGLRANMAAIRSGFGLDEHVSTMKNGKHEPVYTFAPKIKFPRLDAADVETIGKYAQFLADALKEYLSMYINGEQPFFTRELVV